MNYNKELIEFIEKNPTCYHVVAAQCRELESKGFIRLCEKEDWELAAGGKYYVVRNDSAIIAFRIPDERLESISMTATHSDSPCFKLKENPEMKTEGYTKLNCEVYGGPILSSWLDRPLTIAGRLILDTTEGLQSVLVNLEEPSIIIPNLAIHLNRDINKGYEYNPAKDLLPLFAIGEASSVVVRMCEKAEIDVSTVIGQDLYVVNQQKGYLWGEHKELLSSARLDDVQCAYASLVGFLEATDCQIRTFSSLMPMHIVFDNEEVGSSTRQGAASTFLKDTLDRIAEALNIKATKMRSIIDNSLLLSADNAHGLHPNHPDKSDSNNKPILGQGVVLKFAGNQRYTTDGVTAACVRKLAGIADVDIQVYTNRSDMPGGSTLGNISDNQVPVKTADIGIAQLAMHSSFETCAAADTEAMIKLLKAHFTNSFAVL